MKNNKNRFSIESIASGFTESKQINKKTKDDNIAKIKNKVKNSKLNYNESLKLSIEHAYASSEKDIYINALNKINKNNLKLKKYMKKTYGLEDIDAAFKENEDDIEEKLYSSKENIIESLELLIKSIEEDITSNEQTEQEKLYKDVMKRRTPIKYDNIIITHKRPKKTMLESLLAFNVFIKNISGLISKFRNELKKYDKIISEEIEDENATISEINGLSPKIFISEIINNNQDILGLGVSKTNLTNNKAVIGAFLYESDEEDILEEELVEAIGLNAISSNTKDEIRKLANILKNYFLDEFIIAHEYLMYCYRSVHGPHNINKNRQTNEIIEKHLELKIIDFNTSFNLFIRYNIKLIQEMMLNIRYSKKTIETIIKKNSSKE